MSDAAVPGPGEFRCAVCRGIFEKGWSDDEAAAELTTTFPGIGQDECALVCDDCFEKMGLKTDVQTS